VKIAKLGCGLLLIELPLAVMFSITWIWHTPNRGLSGEGAARHPTQQMAIKEASTAFSLIECHPFVNETPSN